MRFLKMLIASVFQWTYRPKKGFHPFNADVVIGLAFGQGAEDPGEVNKSLARSYGHYSTGYDLPGVLQWEIADAVRENLPTQIRNIAHEVKEHRKPGLYLDTYEVLLQAWEFCRERGWKKAIIIAQKHHMWRVCKTAEKLGFEVQPETFLPAAYKPPVHYDPQSTQPWTRSSWRFIPREILGRWLYLLRGHI